MYVFETSNHNLPSKELMRYTALIVRWPIQTEGEIVLYDAQMSCTNIGEDPFNEHQRKSNAGENVSFATFRRQGNKSYYDKLYNP